LGISRAFAFNPGGGAFEILSLPRGKAFAYPLNDPGHLTPLSGFGPARNIEIIDFVKLSKMITFVKIFYIFGILLNTGHAVSVLQ